MVYGHQQQFLDYSIIRNHQDLEMIDIRFLSESRSPDTVRAPEKSTLYQILPGPTNCALDPKDDDLKALNRILLVDDEPYNI